MGKTLTAITAAPLFGNKPYQRYARQALPILVRQATAGRSITYGELAHELGMLNARNLNYVLGSIGQTLILLGQRLDRKIPPIQCLVVNQTTGLPGEGVGWFLNKTDFKQLTRKQKREVVRAQLHWIFGYPKWEKVLAHLGLSPVGAQHAEIVVKASQVLGGGESEHHKVLKEMIAQDPMIVGLPKTTKPGITEYELPSGDYLDVFFSRQKHWIAVEVKSHISDDADIARGIFQCVKYQAVLEALVASLGERTDVRTILAIDRTFPNSLIGLRNTLGVEVMNVNTIAD